MPIELLDKATIDKIAAGEVVERPGSVVKELCENAMDAGASAVTCEIKSGGKALIRVTDNGCGIDKDSVKKAFLRHSTSKLRSIEDLLSIGTLGFRGEALSSISAVSSVTFMTKTAESITGTRYIINGGAEISFTEAGIPDGTTIIVEDLFYNTPARKKFLKSDKAEEAFCRSIFEHLAMSHPDISFRFISNGRTLLETSGNGRLIDVLYHVYGLDMTKNLLLVENKQPKDDQHNAMKLSGYIGNPMTARGTRKYETFFVNGRYVNSTVLSKASEEAFSNYLMKHEFPSLVLFLDIPGTEVDVNVHPTKATVRFSKEDEVYCFVRDSISSVLSKREFVHDMVDTAKGITHSGSLKAETLLKDKELNSIAEQSHDPFLPQRKDTPEVESSIEEHTLYETTPVVIESKEESFKEHSLNESDDSVAEDRYNHKRTIEKQLSFDDFAELDSDADKENTPSVNTPSFRLIGEVFNTYWLLEFSGKLYLVDQHAAHEKVNYERFLNRYHNKSFSGQRIMPPHIITLSPEEKVFFENSGDLFKSYGFEIEAFGDNEVAVYAVPTDLYGMDEMEFFRNLLDEFGSKIDLSEDPDIILNKLATAACKASVRGGDRISTYEANILLKELFSLENPYNCPHGRPTMVSFEKREIEKMFRRIVN